MKQKLSKLMNLMPMSRVEAWRRSPVRETRSHLGSLTRIREILEIDSEGQICQLEEMFSTLMNREVSLTEYGRL